MGPAETKTSWMGPAEMKLSWMVPAETKISWAGPAETPEGCFRLGTGNFPDTGRYPLSNTIPWCLGDPWGDGKRPRAETGGGWPRRATPLLWRTPQRRDSAG